MSKLYWGRAMAQTDVGGLWVRAKVRPKCYWFIRRLRLFLRIVWRRYETERIDWRTAWQISKVAVGLVGPVEIRGGREARRE